MANRGPKGQILPAGITWDPDKRRYRIRWKRVDGTWGTKSAGRNLGVAKRLLAQLKREAREGVPIDQPVTRMTFTEYADRWAAHQRRSERRDTKRARNQLRLHVEPAIGDRKLDEIRPADIVNLCWDLYPGLSANTVTKNIKGYINNVFNHAVFEEACEFNPCASIPRGKLPKPGRNPWPPFERREVEQLLTDPRISMDRRMIYGLAFFLMERCGEVCGIRFSDWDRSLKPLSGVTIDSQYQDQPLKGSRDDYVAVRRVPVHSIFEPVLARWKAAGFAENYGRPPRDDDFIVPRLAPDTGKARSHSQVWKALEADMDLVDVKKEPGRATHGFRKAFITLACNDDEAGMAPESVIKALSHTSTSREAFESYRRWEWATYCEAVKCVRLDLAEPGHVLSIVP